MALSSKEIKKIKMPSHYTASVLANKEDLLQQHMSDEARQELITGFESIDLTAVEHRALFAIFRLYNEHGFNEETVRNGVSFTPYELCKVMGYKSYGNKSYPGSSRHEALAAIESLSSKKYKCLFTMYQNPSTRKISVVAIPNKSIIEISLLYEGDTLTEVGDVLGKRSPRTITAKVCEPLVRANFWRPMDVEFYDRLRHADVKVLPQHWLLQYWLVRSKHDQRKATFDEMLKVLKLADSKTHRARQRDFVLRIFEDFKNAGYLSRFLTDRHDQNGKMVDLLHKNMRRY